VIKIKVLGSRFGFGHGLFRGLNSTSEIYGTNQSYCGLSAIEKMRSDWRRVGGDMKTAIMRAHEQEPHATKHPASELKRNPAASGR
jgi:hypothetical protein